MYTVLIIGYGFVGQAISSVFPRTTFNVIIHDPAKGYSAAFDAIKPDAAFICVPTPTKDELCDDSLVMHYAVLLAHYDCPVIIKSTVPPSTVEKLFKIRQDIVIMPEFLRENNWQDDVKWPLMTIIGCDNQKMLERVDKLIMSSDIHVGKYLFCSAKEASLVKYIANTFLATKVVFMHQMEKWATSQGIKWDNIKSILENDVRIGPSHLSSPGMHGYGFSGSCFPKDIQALVTEAKGALGLLEDVIKQNKILRQDSK
jgi:UDPglucose 6-dehydrogenase